jgi:DHA1 family tetracycline resistance protein-like MFS transporter
MRLNSILRFNFMKAARPALGFIFVTLLIDITGLGIIIPIIPKLVMELTGGTLSQASGYGAWLLFSYAIMQFVCSPIVGGLSDRFGRRPVLLASLFGFGVDYLVMAWAPTLAWLFAGRILAGMLGASFTTASAYIADISPPEKRAQNFGMVGAAFGLGFIIGPVLGGVLGSYGSRIPFFVASAFSLVNWLYGYFILPESLQKENRRAFDWKRANPLGSLRHLGKYPVIAGLIASLVLIHIAAHSVQGTWSYYTMEKFRWTEKDVGYSLGWVGLVVAIVQGLLIRSIIPRLGQKKGIYVGLGFYCAGLLLFGLATEGWMMYAFMLVYGLGGIAGPSLQGVMSSEVPLNEQGELQGAVTSLVSVTSIAGPLIMMNLFSYFTSPSAPLYLPGAPLLFGAFLTLISTVLARSNLKKHA